MNPNLRSRNSQRGVLLLEVLIAIAIFAVGVLAMISVQAVSVAAQADSQYRSEAERLIDRLVTGIRMAVPHDATTGNLTAGALAAYAHRATTTGQQADCNFSGTESTVDIVEEWKNAVLGLNGEGDAVPGTGLPGATDTRLQVVVDTTVAGINQLRITVCWQAPADRAPRRHSTVAYID